MTLEEVFKHLSAIDSQAQELMWEAGIADNSLPWESIAINEDDPDEIYLRDAALGLMTLFRRFHELLDYLLAPCTDEHPLVQFPFGYYGYECASGKSRLLSCGCSVEALIPDGEGRPRWVRSRIEHDGSDYYLFGHHSVPLEGLVVRERSVKS